MKIRAIILVALLALGLAGCSTRPATAPTDTRSATPKDAGTEPLAAGFYPIWIESDPAGGTVVVDGVPQGRTPLRIAVPGSARGFFRTEVSIRVRFVAADAGHLSATMAEEFTPTDRIPSRLTFTPAGVRRTR